MNDDFYDLSLALTPAQDGAPSPYLRTAVVVSTGTTWTIALDGVNTPATVLAGVVAAVNDTVTVLTQVGAPPLVLGATATVDSAWHTVGAAGEPAFQNSWVNFNAGFAPARFQRVGNRVYVEGLIKDGTMPGTAFTLPVGWRPTTGGARLYGIHTGSLEGRVDVHTNGNVHIQSSNTGYVEINVDFPVD